MIDKYETYAERLGISKEAFSYAFDVGWRAGCLFSAFCVLLAAIFAVVIF